MLDNETTSVKYHNPITLTFRDEESDWYCAIVFNNEFIDLLNNYKNKNTGDIESVISYKKHLIK